ncbi:MAG: NepR family anti-sigma factor [Pseudomonadota bacterium]
MGGSTVKSKMVCPKISSTFWGTYFYDDRLGTTKASSFAPGAHQERRNAKNGTATTMNDEDEKPGLDSETQAQLGKKLKEAYADVINEPVPDRFKDLLDQLAASSPNDEKKKGDS